MAESEPLLQEKMEVPHSTFTLAKPDRRGRILPQAIAHRGYKAANPENTMGAFRGAVEVGAHAIETDLHITKDGVLVISHDPSLKRCFGEDKKVIDCDWPYISTLRTLQAPHEPMPRLRDLLEYLTTPGLEDIWILLDIKLDNNADEIMSLIASTIEEVKPTRPWNQRILLGCWAAKYLPLCAIYLPDFPITHIGFSIAYAREFLSVPNINFNMLRQILAGPRGTKFMADTRAAKRSMLVWTVNEEQWMRWCIKKEVDGVITDDPKKYLKVCEEYDSADSNKVGFGFKDWMLIIWLNVLAMLFSWLVRCRFGFKIDKEKVREGYETSRRKRGLSS
ncbi:2ee8710c-0190-46e5-bca8-405a333a12f4 [Sclerotinia trifoliorum]|uniref:2ee8710c-0190-46e5-bca8-405a333a12f4 n=1 Tax=Sclerotinia trifoliorum TaxID=28548 RepID=A0A8H2ZN53_9HELO|nr:2ee8710c-0190-46e5-bca8-405a333a12f4 [Sclerotinia trifoliorum]